jgi:hypothetical protein
MSALLEENKKREHFFNGLMGPDSGAQPLSAIAPMIVLIPGQGLAPRGRKGLRNADDSLMLFAVRG